MFQVKYRCAYRDFWYDDVEFEDWGQAVAQARAISRQRSGGPVVIMVGSTVVFRVQNGQEWS